MIFLRFFWEEKVLEIWVVPNGELQVFTASFLFGFHVWACLFHLWSTMPGSGLCVTPHHHLPWCRNSIVPSQMELTFQKEFTGATFLTASLWYWGHLLWQLLPPIAWVTGLPLATLISHPTWGMNTTAEMAPPVAVTWLMASN